MEIMKWIDGLSLLEFMVTLGACVAALAWAIAIFSNWIDQRKWDRRNRR